MEEKKINKSIIFSVVAVLLIVVVVIGATVAYFSAQAQTDVQTVTTANLSLEFDDDSATILGSDITPISTSEVLTKAPHKNFTIKKGATSSDIYATIKLTDITIPEALAEYDFKWALYQSTNKIATGDFGGKTSEDIILATNQLINSTTGVSYDLYIWINETGLNQNTMQGQTFTAKITASGDNTKKNTLASVILGENNANVTTSAPTFTTTSTDKGLFVQQGDTEKSEMGFPTYYYRGSVTNNYVKFGTYASSGSYTYEGENFEEATFTYTAGDPILWRIVRINEDGSIRLISENVVSNHLAFNSTGDAKYINDDGTDSDVKTAVETWYNTNIGNNSTLDNKVVTSSFCSDITGIDFENYTTGNASARLFTSTPSPIYTCPAGSIKAYEKVGMTTADEMVYGGALYLKSVKNNTTYLNNNSLYWTLTPNDSHYAFGWTSRGASLDSIDVNGGDTASRAVINLSPDVTVTSGDGLSADTAYTVQ